MVFEPLKKLLLSFYKIKKDTLLYYFDNCISSQIEKLNYE